MKIDIITLFPKMFSGPFTESIVKRAVRDKKVIINIHNLRDWATNKHKSVDDRPFGGGVGMILMIEPIYRALTDLKSNNSKVILLTPSGKKYDQRIAQKLSSEKHIILICGHYEGYDERIKKLTDIEISIGDYVLTGGEIPAMVIIDSIVRLLPGVLKKEDATIIESFSENLLEYPQFTRPENFKGWKVPKILLSGNHKKIEKWRKEKSQSLTKKYRSDLIK